MNSTTTDYNQIDIKEKINSNPSPLKVLKGEKSDFKNLYSRYKNKLVFYAIGFVHSKPLAEDLVHDIFLKMMLNHYDLSDDFIEAYLYRSTKNQCMNYLRHQKVEKNYNNQLMYHHETHSGDEVYWEWCLCILKKIIDNLPYKYKITFKLRLNDGLTNREISDYLGISLKTVEYRIRKANYILSNEMPDY